MSWIINILLIFFDTDFIQNLNLKLSWSLSLLPIDFYWHPILNQKVQDFLIKLQRIDFVFRCKVPILFRWYSVPAIQFRADVFLQPRRRHQHDHNKIGISKFWWNMKTHRWWQLLKWKIGKNVLREVKNVSKLIVTNLRHNSIFVFVECLQEQIRWSQNLDEIFFCQSSFFSSHLHHSENNKIRVTSNHQHNIYGARIQNTVYTFM